LELLTFVLIKDKSSSIRHIKSAAVLLSEKFSGKELLKSFQSLISVSKEE
jgi:hypothetical protein